MTDLYADAQAVLRTTWGYPDFRLAQAEVVKAALAGEDVLAILPTGGGKSICFQVPALVEPGCALVVSPLIALMKDQVDDCVKRGIPASYVNSHLDPEEIAQRLTNLRAGQYKLFYVAPERLAGRDFLEAIQQTDVSRLVADEAHCVVTGTMILMADGTSHAIETIRIGDMVSTYDHETGKLGTRRVTAVGSSKVAARRLFTLLAGTGHCVNLTGDHPVFVINRGYVRADDVVQGNRLLLSDDIDRGAQVLALRELPNSEESTVWNLDVDVDHNYFASGILLHNCVSRDGHDFRPAYMHILDVLPAITAGGKRPPIMGLTATATAEIEDDVAKGLGLRPDYIRIVGDPVRPNLDYKVMSGNEWGALRMLVGRFDRKNGRFIVYAATRNLAAKLTELIAETLGRTDVVGLYHAGLAPEERTRVQDAFKAGTLPIVVATIAFGMGIDVPNIRSVVHFGIPGCPEDYSQQAGRAGRDGLPSDVVLLHSERSVETQRFFIDNANPPIPLYAAVWKWLLENTSPGETIMKSGEEIAGMVKRASGIDATGSQVLSILGLMESRGLLERRPSGSKTPVRIKRSWEDASRWIANHPRSQRIVEALWKGNPAVETTVHVEKAKLVFALHVSTPVLNGVLKKLADDDYIDVGDTFTGKTTRVIKRNVNLEEVLPLDDLRAKRLRATRRLDAMLAYTIAKDRRAFLRDYFRQERAGIAV